MEEQLKLSEFQMMCIRLIEAQGNGLSVSEAGYLIARERGEQDARKFRLPFVSAMRSLEAKGLAHRWRRGNDQRAALVFNLNKPKS